MHILNVAEKPSIAKSVSQIISNGTSRSFRAPYKYTPYHKFKHDNHDFIFTAVVGHLFNYTAGEKISISSEHIDIYRRAYERMNNREYFEEQLKNIRWDEKGALKIYSENISVKLPDKKLIDTLRHRADVVIIWTDNDREGEHIAREIADIIGESYGLTNYSEGGIVDRKKFDRNFLKNDRKIFSSKNEIKFSLKEILQKNAIKKYKIFRARFNSLCKEDIMRALENLTLIDYDMVMAVDTRIEMDMRSGFSLTRIFTIYLKTLLSSSSVISYGQCQIPTLGFVVDRYLQFKNFISEEYYFLIANAEVEYLKRPICDCYAEERMMKILICKWNRKIFDKNCTVHFFNELMKIKEKKIKIARRQINVPKPLPLRTTTLMKALVSKYKISSFKAMEICEKLYTGGYISYPRTETDIYPKNFDFKKVLARLSPYRIQKSNSITEFQKVYEICEKQYSSSSIENKFITNPRMGRNNDQSHLPIYPIKPYSKNESLESKVFHFIFSQFLSTIHVNGTDEKITVEIKIGEEIFTGEHTRIKKLGFREISHNVKISDGYDIINASMKDMEMQSGETKPLPLLTEPVLISLMDQNGIGTDATIHEHIKKVLDRKYVYKEKAAFLPSNIGLSLVNSCMKILNSSSDEIILHKPFLRGQFEKKLNELFNGSISKYTILQKERQMYEDITKRIIEQKSDFIGDLSPPPVQQKRQKTMSSIKCHCGENSAEFTSNTEKNKNRVFLSCNKFPAQNKCKFFQWKN